MRRRPRGALRLAAFACCLAVLVAVGGSSAPAQDLHTRLNQAKAKLGHAKAREGVLSTTIQRYSGQIDTLAGQVATLRNREAMVQQVLKLLNDPRFVRSRDAEKGTRKKADLAAEVVLAEALGPMRRTFLGDDHRLAFEQFHRIPLRRSIVL